MRPAVTALAPAKINLALSVGPPDDSGMHPICSWMVTVDLCDELLLTRLEADRLSRYAILWHEQAKRPSDIDWSITRDLAVRAHLEMERHLNRRLPVQMKLEKRIPVGGGLGGGSSDAAAMLRGLNELFDLGLATDEMAAIGAGIGADVPFLVHGGSAIVEGEGERIEPHEDLPALHAVIAFPEAACPTGEVYHLFDEFSAAAGAVLRPEAVRSLAASFTQSAAGPAGRAGQSLFNDLAAAAFRAAPALQEQVQRLRKMAELPVHISGSGSSLYVLCDDAIHAEALAAAIEQRLSIPAAAVTAQAIPRAERCTAGD